MKLKRREPEEPEDPEESGEGEADDEGEEEEDLTAVAEVFREQVGASAEETDEGHSSDGLRSVLVACLIVVPHIALQYFSPARADVLFALKVVDATLILSFSVALIIGAFIARKRNGVLAMITLLVPLKVIVMGQIHPIEMGFAACSLAAMAWLIVVQFESMAVKLAMLCVMVVIAVEPVLLSNLSFHAESAETKKAPAKKKQTDKVGAPVSDVFQL